jgi:hypothetical protein
MNGIGDSPANGGNAQGDTMAPWARLARAREIELGCSVFYKVLTYRIGAMWRTHLEDLQEVASPGVGCVKVGSQL